MRIAPAFPISPLIAIPSKFLTTVATSLTAVPPWVLWGVTQRPTVSVGFPCVLRARLRACARGEEEGWGREALRPLLSKVARWPTPTPYT